MGKIMLEFDSNLKKSEILIPLKNISAKDADEKYKDSGFTDKDQTAITGIIAPLIMINNTIIDFDKIHYFELKSIGVMPELVMTVEDKYEIINNIDKPGNDNEVRVQILPKFDNAYKKIDLTFFISNIKVEGALLRLICSYKLPALTSSQFVALGEIDTYTLFKEIATKTGLGFASNIKLSNDKRFVYADHKSWLDLMNAEIKYSNTTEYALDYWIDFWDNINIADIKERYNAVDSQDDIMLWVAGNVREISMDNEIEPQRVPAILHNHPAHANSELYVKKYEIINNSGSGISKGSDKVYAIFEENKGEYLDHLLQDGDVKNDIFTKYEYLGECYGNYNYILSKSIREGFFQKIGSEKIKITLQSPILGLARGHKVNFIRYVNDDKIEQRMKILEENGYLDRNVNSNIPLDEFEITEEGANGKFRLDRSVSAQYLISSINIIFNNNTWDYVLTLVRPASSKPNILKENNE